MKKKILAIVVVSIFLLLGCSSISVVGKEAGEQKQLDQTTKTYFFSEVELDGTAQGLRCSIQRIEEDEGWNNIWFGLYATLEVASGTLTIIPRFREPVTVYPGEQIKISLFHGKWREIEGSHFMIDQLSLEGLMVTIL